MVSGFSRGAVFQSWTPVDGWTVRMTGHFLGPWLWSKSSCVLPRRRAKAVTPCIGAFFNIPPSRLPEQGTGHHSVPRLGGTPQGFKARGRRHRLRRQDGLEELRAGARILRGPERKPAQIRTS